MNILRYDCWCNKIIKIADRFLFSTCSVHFFLLPKKTQKNDETTVMHVLPRAGNVLVTVFLFLLEILFLSLL